MNPAATATDLLQQAGATTNSVERRTLLEQAEVAARHASDWLDIADAWAVAGDRNAAERCLAAGLRHSDDGIGDYRRAAATWLHQLADRQAAVRTMDTLEKTFASRPDTAGYEWRLLAEGYAEILKDTAAVRRCLDSASAVASTADDLCSLAKGFAELLGDRVVASQLVERAERLAASAEDTHGGSSYWTVANTWKDFEDLHRARACFHAGLAKATDVQACLTIAAGWASHEEPEGSHLLEIRGCLRKARSLATSFDDWYELADTTRQFDRDRDEVRSCLEQARRRATEPAERRKLARALRDWLGDEVDAAALGPRGLTPAELAPPGPSPLGWPRDAGALFDWLRTRIDQSTLESIAEADYGNDRDDHLAVLLDIWRTGLVPVPLEWHPHEVLALRHWDEGLAVDHVARAFCCTLLCLPELAGDGREHDLGSTFAVLAESCIVLGPEALARLAGLLIAFLDGHGGCDDEVHAFATLALLIVGARIDARDERLEALAGRLLALEAGLAQRDSYPHPEHGFVLGTTFFDQRVQVWRALVRDAFGGLAVAGRPVLAQVVRRLLE